MSFSDSERMQARHSAASSRQVFIRLNRVFNFGEIAAHPRTVVIERASRVDKREQQHFVSKLREMDQLPVLIRHLKIGHSVPTCRNVILERVLVHVDTELGAKALLNNRMAYVAVSRGVHVAQLFTNDREKLPAALGHEVSRESAHTPQQEIAPKHEHGYGLELGL